MSQTAPRRVAAWARTLLRPTLPGMDDGSPRARPLPLLAMALWIAGMTVARYQLEGPNDKAWQGLYILVGLLGVFAILLLAHGRAVLTRIDRRALLHVGIGLGAYLVFWHFGRMDAYFRWIEPLWPRQGSWGPIHPFIYFASCALALRLVVPFTVARVFLRRRPGELGLHAPSNPHPSAARPVWPVYLGLYLIVLPFVVHAAGTPAFQAKYPMARAMIAPDGTIGWEHFVVYEAFYLGIFVSGEALWRGYFAFGLERRLGLYALPVMIVPYVTSHFGKPLPETLGAILAGFVLGWLALKHRSIWLGVALHFGIALSMDVLAVLARGIRLV